MPAKVDQTKFLAFIKSLNADVITTSARKKKFKVTVVDDNLIFVPLSSGKLRKEPANNLTKVLDNYNDNMSLLPRHYQELTFNSVYIIALLELYLKILPA